MFNLTGNKQTIALCLSGVTLFILATDVQADERIQWSHNKHFYQLFPDSLHWIDAQDACQEIGGHLVTITSTEEHNFIISKISGLSFQYWLGAADSLKEGRFTWVTGEKWKYKADLTDLDISNSNSDEVDYFYVSGKSWNLVYSAGDYSSAYICEWSTNNHIGMTAVPDLNGNGSSEIAALYVNYVTTKHTVKIQDPKTDAAIKTLTFSDGLQAPQGIVTVDDINGNGVPEIGVLYLKGGQPTVDIKDALDNSLLLKTLPFLNNGFNPKEITVLPDTNGNGSSEIAVLGLNKNTNASEVEIRDSSTGELLDDTRF